MQPRNELDANAIVHMLLELSRRMGDLADRMDQVEEDAVNAREDYTMAYAKAFISAVGSVDLRKQLAIEQTHAERINAESAEAKVRGMKRQAETLKTRVEVGRSAAALVRSEAEFLSVPQTRRQR